MDTETIIASCKQKQQDKIPEKNAISFSHTLSVMVGISDVLVILGAGILMFFLERSTESVSTFSPCFAAMVFCAGMTVACFYHFGLYDTRLLSNLRKVVLLESVLFSFMLALAFVVNIIDEFSRVWVVAWFLSTVVLMVSVRFHSHAILQKWGQRWCATGDISRNIAVIGAERHGVRLLEIIEQQKEPWMQVIGVFEDRFSRVPTRIGDHPVLGTVNDLISYIQEHQVDDVFITLPWSAGKRIREIIEKLELLSVNIYLTPDVVGYNVLHHSFSEYCGLPILDVSKKPAYYQ